MNFLAKPNILICIIKYFLIAHWERIHLQCRRPRFDSRVGKIRWRGIGYPLQYSWASLVAQLVKNLPAMQETWVRSLSGEDPLEKGKATHCSILAWRIPWTTVHGVTKNWTQLSNFHVHRWLSGKKFICQCKKPRTYGFDPWVRKIPWRRKWQPTPVFLPGKSQGQRSLEGYNPWGQKESDTTEWLKTHTHYKIHHKKKKQKKNTLLGLKKSN